MMADFFQNLVYNQFSFLIGFAAGALGLWLFTKLRPALPGLIHAIRTRSKSGGAKLLSSNADRLGQDTMRYVQGLHIASPLFALDEVLVEPGFLPPQFLLNLAAKYLLKMCSARSSPTFLIGLSSPRATLLRHFH